MSVPALCVVTTLANALYSTNFMLVHCLCTVCVCVCVDWGGGGGGGGACMQCVSISKPVTQ